MKSVKPGRGPSFLGGVVCLFMALFGVLWTVAAFSIDAGLSGVIFSLFGIIFVGIAVVNAIYNFKNATGKNRYSEFDITDGDEEPDPLNERFGSRSASKPTESKDDKKTKNKFCPYCGAEVGGDYTFCNSCGKKLP